MKYTQVCFVYETFKSKYIILNLLKTKLSKPLKLSLTKEGKKENEEDC